MNPLFMQMMMNMGMGCAPSPFMMGMNFFMPSLFCGCSNFMTMPYYQNDNLGFLNFPVIRNTSADFLLDPNLALRQCQANWQNGGGFVGSTILPGFSFPQIAPIAPIGSYPTMPGAAQPSQRTEAEKEAEKKKQEEAKKPAAQKAQKLNEVFTKVKKLAEDKANLFPEISEELSKKAEEAMKKGTAEEQYAAMKEVLAVIPAETLRKAALADDKIKIMLRKAGYNFNLMQNKYSVKNDDIKENDIDHIDKLRLLHTDIQEKKFNELQLITGLLSHTDEAKSKILGVISSWNDRFNSNTERGIIRYIAANLPLGQNEEGKLDAVRECTKVFVMALLAKADEFEGYEKIAAARDKVTEQFNVVFAENTNGFNQVNINKLADACDALYARMRMQEAVAVKEYVKRNYGDLNEIHEDTITERTIIEETEKDLKLEGLTPITVNDLDKPPVSQELVAQREAEVREIDNQYEGDAKGKIDKLIADGELKKVDGQENIYQAKIIGGWDNYTGYYILKDNKIYPIRKNTIWKIKDNDEHEEEVRYEELKNAKEVSAEYIVSTNLAVERANSLTQKGALRILPSISGCTRQFFKSTGGRYEGNNQYYVLQNGKLYHIINAKQAKRTDPNNIRSPWVMTFNDGREVPLNKISASDLEEFDDKEVKTVEQAKEERMANWNKDVAIVEAHQYSSLNDIAYSNEEMDKISRELTATTEKPDGEPGKFYKVKVGVQGYFYSDLPNKSRIYKYDVKTGKLKFLEIRALYDSGYAETSDGKQIHIAEVFMDKEYTGPELITKIQEYGLSFAKIVSGPDPNMEKYFEAYRKLHTIIAINDPVYTINFIKGYQSNTGFWTAQSNGMFKQMYEETEPAFSCEGDPNKMNTQENFVKCFAELLLKVADTTGFDRNSTDYADLQKIARGEHISCYTTTTSFCKTRRTLKTGIQGTSLRLDQLVEKVMEAYDKKYGA